MAKDEEKVQRFVKIPCSDKDKQFLSTLKESANKAFITRLKGNMLILLDKLRRGTRI